LYSSFRDLIVEVGIHDLGNGWGCHVIDRRPR
jgi:hypothetical protein